MALSPGTLLGPYEIVSLIGAGGMGEVYRARDAKLNRDVALKVLPAAFTLDVDRLARFRREAQVLASLNHPHIGAIYGLEESTGIQALVLELIDGLTLADRLQRGPMRVEEALAVACQIAEALEAAHERGIVHRDLKPANVKLTANDRVKVLDFGLAKAMEQSPAAASIANSPTLSVLATQAGMIMGTAAYMSPEQAKGSDTDRRSDIFSFGVVLYEMLTARQPFQGDTAAEIMASVLIREGDRSALPANLHPRISEVIARCLEKQPKKRWQSIGDVRLELEAIATAPYNAPAIAAVAAKAPLWQRALPVVIAVALTAAVSTAISRMATTRGPADVVRFTFASPDFRTTSPAIAISPDGRRVAYAGITGSDRTQLMLRNLEDADAHPIPGTSIRGNITSPVFSPDGRFIAYYSPSDHVLRKIAITGGAAVNLCSLALVPIGSVDWHDDEIVVAQGTGIFKVPANGGEPRLAISVPTGSYASSPQIVDDRGTILYALATSGDQAYLDVLTRWDKAEITVQRSDGTRQRLGVGADPRYLSTGHLVYAVAGSLFAVPFDAAKPTIAASPTPVVAGVMRSATGNGTQLAISRAGTIAYVAGPSTASAARTLGLLDLRDGRVQPIPITPNAYTQPRLSPDGSVVAVASDDGKEAIIWIYDLNGRGSARRLTFAGRNTSPIWTPDGRFITYQSTQPDGSGLLLQRADGTGGAERLTKAGSGVQHFPDSWSPDGKILLFREQSTTASIWMVARDGDRTPKRLLHMPDRSQVLAQFSPDGRWIAYGSNELNGTSYQVFVQPFPPDSPTKFQAETQTGSAPLWSRDGRQLFFAFANRVFVQAVETSPRFVVGQPAEVRGTERSLASLPAVRNFDLTPDGKQLLMILTDQANDTSAGSAGQQINVVINWTEELKQLVPVR